MHSLMVTYLFLVGFCSAINLPTVNLGYEVHQALSLNAPVGDLRWALPLAPTGVQRRVQNGSVGRICPQGMPRWFTTTSLFQRSYAAGSASSFDYDTALANTEALYPNGTGSHYSTLTYTTDDCLFLDVIVPQQIFEAGRKSKAPVMVWIHGGAYVTGNKVDSSAGDPSGLIAASQEDGSLGIIYVSINYRLGGLGFISGESYESEGGVSNLGLHDQRLALKWVQEYIHLFGGDPKKVTVSGGTIIRYLHLRVKSSFLTTLPGSAGAGSIIYHLASKDKEDLPFQQAYVESPGLLPTSNSTRELASNKLLELLGVRSFAEARTLPSEQIIRANADVISAAKTSNFIYAPVEDGNYIPETVADTMRSGHVHKGVKLMISHTKNEGYSFMPSYANTDDSFTEYLEQMFPYESESTISYIVNDLFPVSEYGGVWYERVADFVGNFGLKCPAHALTKAYGNETYNYEWSVFPAFHGYDFLNIFFAGNRYGGIVNSSYVELLQSYIANFVKNGNPNGDGLLAWPVEGPSSHILNLTGFGPVLQKDSTANNKCLWLETHDLLL